MEEINGLDIKGFITNGITGVFDTMLSLDIEPANSDSQADQDEKQIVGTVSFAGEVMGNVNVAVSHTFARLMTANMLDMELDEIDGEEEIHDVIGEVSNMVCGFLKSRLCDSGISCNLSIPSVTSGSDFNIEPMGWQRQEKIAFRYEEHKVLVDVYIITGN